MTTEQRVIASKTKIGAKPGGGAVAAPAEAPAKSGKKKLMIIGIVVAVLGGAASWFLMGPGAAAPEGEAAVVEESAPEPGEVLAVEAVSINLAGGHYLRLGLGLQFTAEAGGHGKPDPAKALDLAIALYSGRSVDEVASAEGRVALKAELLHQLEEAYHHEVMDVYLMDYVTQ